MSTAQSQQFEIKDAFRTEQIDIDGLKSNFTPEVREVLFGALYSVTDSDTKALWEEYSALETSQQREDFFAGFEGKADERDWDKDPAGLQKFTKFLSTAVLLMNIAEDTSRLSTIQHIQDGTLPSTRLDDVYAQPASQVTLVAESLEEAIHQAKAVNVPVERVVEQLSSICLRPILTAHPTQAKSSELLGSINNLRKSIDAFRHGSDLTAADLTAHVTSVLEAQSVPDRRATVSEEVATSVEYLHNIYRSYPELRTRIVQSVEKEYGDEFKDEHKVELRKGLNTIIQPGSWAGGDADGNDNVEASETIDAIGAHRAAISRHHIRFLKDEINRPLASDFMEIMDDELKERLQGVSVVPYTLKGVRSASSAFFKDISAMQDALSDYAFRVTQEHGTKTTIPFTDYGTGKPTELDPSEYLQDSIERIRGMHRKFLEIVPNVATALDAFENNVAAFDMRYARIDIRQHSGIMENVANEVLKPHLASLCAGLQEKGLGENIVLIQDQEYKDLSEADKQRVITAVTEDKAVLEAIGAHFKSDTYKHLEDKSVQRELERMTVMAKFPDIMENFILSNNEEPSHMLNALFVAKAMGAAPNIVPLFESEEALGNAARMMEAVYGNRAYRAHVQSKGDKQIEFFGYSDSQRASGPCVQGAVLTAIAQIKEVEARYGVTGDIFHGNGGDTNRGGRQVHEPHQTLQGRSREYVLADPEDFSRYASRMVAQQFKRGLELEGQSPLIEDKYSMDGLEQLRSKGTPVYRELFDKKNGFGNVLERMFGQNSPFAMFVKGHNFSSRATSRGIAETDTQEHTNAKWCTGGDRGNVSIVPLNKLRAISQTNAIEMGFTNFCQLYSLGEGLEGLGDHQRVALFRKSPKFRQIVQKGELALEKANMELAWNYFAEDQRPDSPAQQKQWAREAREGLAAAQAAKAERNGTAEENQEAFDAAMAAVQPNHLMALIQQNCAKAKREIEKLKKSLGIESTLSPDLLEDVKSKQVFAEPAQRLMARINRKVVLEGGALDAIYPEQDQTFYTKLPGDVYVGVNAEREPPRTNDDVAIDRQRRQLTERVV